MHVSQPSHGAYWWKTLGVVAADNQYFAASIAMEAPYTSYSNFPFLFQDNSEILVEFILSSIPLTSWASSHSGTWFRLPHEVVNSIDLRSLYSMTILHWIISQYSSFEFENTGYSQKASVISTDINSITLPAGFVIVSGPSWLTIDVYDNSNNRVASTYL